MRLLPTFDENHWPFMMIICNRYQHQLSDGNALITRWLLALTQEHRDWGFGLCFAYIRNVQGLRFNHKRVYRIYCELALNLRIKPKRRINT